MSNIEKLLDDEIQSQMTDLSDMNLGTDEYKVTVDGITKLVDKTIELKKLEIESEHKVRDREEDSKLKKQQMEDEKHDRKVRNGIAIAGVVVPTLVTIWGTLKSFKFEETGNVTTIMGRGFINKLLPKK